MWQWFLTLQTQPSSARRSMRKEALECWRARTWRAAVVSRAQARLRRNSLRRVYKLAFGTWRADAGLMRARQRFLQVRLAGLVASLGSGRCRPAFLSWRGHVVEERVKATTVDKGRRKIQRRAQEQAMGAWVYSTQRRRVSRRKLARAEARSVLAW